jgi:hypothetical protein
VFLCITNVAEQLGFSFLVRVNCLLNLAPSYAMCRCKPFLSNIMEQTATKIRGPSSNVLSLKGTVGRMLPTGRQLICQSADRTGKSIKQK